MSFTDRGTCSHCGREFLLRKDGTVHHHGGELRPYWAGGMRRDYRCPGAGQRPKETAP